MEPSWQVLGPEPAPLQPGTGPSTANRLHTKLGRARGGGPAVTSTGRMLQSDSRLPIVQEFHASLLQRFLYLGKC